MTDLSALSNADIEALIDWYRAMGVSACVENKPTDWRHIAPRAFDALAPAPAPVLPPPAEASKPEKSALAPSPQLSLLQPDQEERQKKARQSADQAETLTELREALEAFDGCLLKDTARSLVFGDGNPESGLMLIGEAPGRDEDAQGLPFVGRSGQLLDRMMAAIGLDRSGYYITNIIPWRPPGNRAPSAQEIELMRPFFLRHIALVSPKVLLFLGATAAHTLTGRQESLMRLRGSWLDCQVEDQVIPALPTFHPAFLLRQPLRKADSWRDLMAFRKKARAL